MAMTAMVLLGALAAPAEAAPAVTAEAAIVRYREVIKPIAELDCPKSDDPEEAVVCGRSDGPDPHRLLVTVREPGEPVRLLPGEPPRPDSAVFDCLRLCPQPVDLIKAAQIGVKIIDHLLHGDR